ncbi:hypothetical protein GCM10010317_026630 [Streptomyces mirabilis]|nr:hypothetical protein GCM10010317_026630 [Streptomyces mirabilis]
MAAVACRNERAGKALLVGVGALTALYLLLGIPATEAATTSRNLAPAQSSPSEQQGGQYLAPRSAQ